MFKKFKMESNKKDSNESKKTSYVDFIESKNVRRPIFSVVRNAILDFIESKNTSSKSNIKQRTDSLESKLQIGRASCRERV